MEPPERPYFPDTYVLKTLNLLMQWFHVFPLIQNDMSGTNVYIQGIQQIVTHT